MKTLVLLCVLLLQSTMAHAALEGVKGVKLKHLFCDMKRVLAQRDGNLNKNNYKKVIDLFKDEMGCTGIRVHIDPNTAKSDIAKVAPDSKPESYTKLYRDVFAYARERNLLIYANTLPDENSKEYDFDVKKWVDAVSAYTNTFCPDFVGPFNENNSFDKHSAVVKGLKAKIQKNCRDPIGNTIDDIKIIGPDSGVVRAALSIMENDPDLAQSVDYISSHNNKGGHNFIDGGAGAGDRSATKSDWIDLFEKAGGPIWASESGAYWSNTTEAGDHKGEEVGIKAIMQSGTAEALVLYMALDYIDLPNEKLTRVGQEIFNGLHLYGWAYPVKDGSRSEDKISGVGSRNDIIFGKDGDDTLRGKDGDDRLSGGNGADTVRGGEGGDLVFGGAGNDTIYGGAGNDILSGGGGKDIIFAKIGDTVNSGNGHDIVDLSKITGTGYLKIDGHQVKRLANGRFELDGRPVQLNANGAFYIGNTKVLTVSGD